MTEHGTDWVTAVAEDQTFGTYTDKDELLHGTGPEGDSLTETWYWGFNVPEANINCFAYCWVHPNLKVVSAGLFIYQGVKSRHMACELFDVPSFMSADVVGDGSDIVVPNSMRMQVIEPLKHIHMTFSDPVRETEVDLHLRAVAEPVMRANGKHFEQVMHVTGSLVLRGKHHGVDCYNVRDRSWGELRPEAHNPGPPYNWITGVLDDGATAFNLGTIDTDDPVAALKDGWVRRDGRVLRLARATKRIERDRATLRPTKIVVDAEDTEGQTYAITGTELAGVPWGGWNNITCHLALMRWELDGRVGYGESQDVQWNDYVWRNSENLK
jgi:hypothetical protein